ncbi:hypothetical protein AVEN_162469-1, partial [Araneus ventricosus]
DTHKESWQPGWESQLALDLEFRPRHVYPLTCIFPDQGILMNQHREALSRLLGSSPLMLNGVYRLFGFGMVLQLGASSSYRSDT